MKIRKEILLGAIFLACFFIAYKIGRHVKCKNENSHVSIEHKEKLDSLEIE
jgi:hypothetical protein